VAGGVAGNEKTFTVRGSIEGQEMSVAGLVYTLAAKKLSSQRGNPFIFAAVGDGDSDIVLVDELLD